MLRYFLLVCYGLLIQVSTRGQAPLVKTAGRVVLNGITWFQSQTDSIYGGPMSINLLVIDPGQLELDVVVTDSLLRPVAELAKRKNALAGINASFFDFKTARTVQYLMVDGQVIKDQQTASYVATGAIVTQKNALPRIMKRNGKWRDRIEPEFDDLLVSGPLLIFNDTIQHFQPDNFNQYKHPRTAFGIQKDGSLVFLTVDGRSGFSLGMTIPELADLMKNLGCQYAINLDGGGSTTLWIEGEGVVNHPSDNRKFDHEGARSVADALIIRKRN